MKRIFITALVFSLLLIPSTAVATDANTSDNASYTFGDFTIEVEVEASAPAPTPSGNGNGIRGSGGADGEVIYGIETVLFGDEITFYTGYDGGISETVEATSEDGNLTVTIPKGTTILDEQDNPLKTLGVAVDENPPSPPENANIIGLTYAFEPSGATFDPPITFTWSYDPNALPEGVAERNLGLAYHDGVKWVELECVVDAENNIITALVSHFTTFAVLGFVTPVPIPAPVLPPAPTPEPPTITPEPEPTITPPMVIAPALEPIPEGLPAPVLPPELEPSPFNWLVAVLFGLVSIVVIVAVVWVLRRRRAEG